MRVLITGGNGQLGSSLRRIIRFNNFADFQITSQRELDISQEKNIRDFFHHHQFDFLINCAAYTDVDQAETDADAARCINAYAPQWMARYAKKKSVKVIHISTDYVFDGSSNLPLTPDTPVHPVSVYGRTKLEGEQLLLSENPESIVIRTSWLYSEFGNNFLKTMMNLGSKKETLKVVFDQIGTPTYAGDLAAAILNILELANYNTNTFVPGVYHYSNEGVCSWYDFAVMILKLSGIKCSVLPVRSDEFPTAAKRPAFSVLDKSKIKSQFNISIPHWQEGLEKCLVNLNK